MRSPPRNESDAFGFLLFLVAGLIPVAIAGAFGPAWLALTLLAAAVAAAVAGSLGGRRVELRLKSAPAHAGAADERRILVVASDTLDEAALGVEIERLASAPRTHVLVLAPAAVSPRRRWLGDLDAALDEARRRLDEALGRVRAGLDIRGEVSDADPLQAIEDTLTTFAADEIVVSTRGERSPEGLEPRLAGFAGERFALPVAHFVVETETPALTHA